VVDYKIHTHATYAVCDAADAFQAAPAYTRKLASDKAKQAEQVGRCALVAMPETVALWQADCDPASKGAICGSAALQVIVIRRSH
jgi:hypothetical protein